MRELYKMMDYREPIYMQNIRIFKVKWINHNHQYRTLHVGDILYFKSDTIVITGGRTQGGE